MEITGGKLIAVVVTVVVVAIAYFWSLANAAGGATHAAGASAALGAVLLFPLSLIWFPEFWGDHLSFRITRKTPEAVVSVAGWFLLFAIPGLFYFVARAHGS
jgi:hypothetical protein